MIEALFANVGAWGDWETVYSGQTTTTTVDSQPAASLVALPDSTPLVQYSEPEWEYDRRVNNYSDWSSWSTVSSSQTSSSISSSAPSSGLVDVPGNTTTNQYQNPDWALVSDVPTYTPWSPWSLFTLTSNTQTTISSSPPSTSSIFIYNTDTSERKNPSWLLTGSIPKFTEWSTWRTRYDFASTPTAIAQKILDMRNTPDTSTREWRNIERYTALDGNNYYYLSYQERTCERFIEYDWVAQYERRTRSVSYRTYTWQAVYERRSRSISSYTYYWNAKYQRRFFV